LGWNAHQILLPRSDPANNLAIPLSLQAQDGASRDELIGVVETAMTALDT
jgi:hypothetical protein